MSWFLCMVLSLGSNFTSLHGGIWFSQHHLLKKLFFPRRVVLAHLLKTIYAWAYFWAVSSFPLVYMSVFMPIPYCFDYCNFVMWFQDRKWEACCFVLSQLFWLLEILCGSIWNFRIFFLILQKLHWDCIESVDRFGYIWDILIIVHEHRMSLHLFVFSLISFSGVL